MAKNTHGPAIAKHVLPWQNKGKCYMSKNIYGFPIAKNINGYLMAKIFTTLPGPKIFMALPWPINTLM